MLSWWLLLTKLLHRSSVGSLLKSALLVGISKFHCSSSPFVRISRLLTGAKWYFGCKKKIKKIFAPNDDDNGEGVSGILTRFFFSSCPAIIEAATDQHVFSRDFCFALAPPGKPYLPFLTCHNQGGATTKAMRAGGFLLFFKKKKSVMKKMHAFFFLFSFCIWQ